MNTFSSFPSCIFFAWQALAKRSSRKVEITFFLAMFAVALGAPASAKDSNQDQPLRYLGIGNSFTWNSTKYLEKIVESQGREIDCYVAGIGGASMEEHWKRIEAFEADAKTPEGKPYNQKLDGVEGPYSLDELLEKKEWDVISIQQLSWKSIDFSTYEPFAGNLIRYIRERAPQAEIVIHMTWAYREEHDMLKGDELDQQIMYDRLVAAYTKLSEKYGLRIVPIGATFQEARAMDEWQFSYPEKDFDYENPVYPDMPEQHGSLIAGWGWKSVGDSGEHKFVGDFSHANSAGCYAGGLTHFQFLYGEPADPETVFVPESLDRSQATSLIKAADQAIKQYSSNNESVVGSR